MEANLNSCLVLLELAGLQYFSLKSLDIDAKKGPSIPRTVYMLFLLVCINALTIAFIVNDKLIATGDLTTQKLLTCIVQRSISVGMVLVLCTSFVQSYVTTENIMKVHLNSKEIARLSQVFKIFINFKKVKIKAWKMIWMMFGFLATVHGSLMLAHLNNSAEILQILLGCLPMVFLLVIVYKFVFYVNMVNSQLKFLNKLLCRIFQYQPIKIIDNINYHLMHVKPLKPADDTLSKLRVIWKIYNNIYESGILINESIGLTVLVLFMGIVIALTVSGYEMYIIIAGGLPTSRIPGESFSIFKS